MSVHALPAHLQKHEAHLLHGGRIDWNKPPHPTTRVQWSKRDTSGDLVTGSVRTICHLNRLNNLAIARFDYGIEIIQPSYNTGVPASAGTHNLDACVDWMIPGVPWWTVQKFGRANGHACWYRHPPLFGNHVHGFTLPPWAGNDRSQDFARGGFKVGLYVDGGWSTLGRLASSSQIADYYAHAFGLSGQHTPGSDHSWFPANIRSTIFSLDRYIEVRAS